MKRYVSQLDFDNLDFKNEALKYPKVEDIIKQKLIVEEYIYIYIYISFIKKFEFKFISSTSK